LSPSENRTYLPYHIDLLPSRDHVCFFIHLPYEQMHQQDGFHHPYLLRQSLVRGR
jgi:hypothetical protein